MENIGKVDPLAATVSCGADSTHENHPLEINMGEVSHALPSPTPFNQAGVSSFDVGEIAHVLPSLNSSHSLERESEADGNMVLVYGPCRRFSFDAIKNATNNFDEELVVGKGGFGNVYKGSLSDGTTMTVVAIKRLNASSNQGADEFWSEVNLLSNFRHTNLVSLIGYCNENQEMILVYEYMAGGALADHLYKSSKEESGKSISHLTWTQRLNICLGAARGLEYLHTGLSTTIIHRDVKSTNILLDENWVAKVSDFGISKCITSPTATHVSTKFKGTIGYGDPEYILKGRLTEKSDVYAFGVVLLEVLCGRQPTDKRLKDQDQILVDWAKEHIKKGTLDQLTDPSLNGETTPHSLKCIAELANKCLHTESKDRPTMSEVVESLEIAMEPHEREGSLHGTTLKAFQGNGSNDGGGPILGYLAQSAYSRLSLEDIRAATNDFNDDHLFVDEFDGVLIPRDVPYFLYKGSMVGGTRAVIIKRYQSDVENFTERVRAEIRVEKLTPHPNILSLVGFCEEEDELILVYEYMVNGTLNGCLYKTRNNPLHWKKRLEICIDIARGLEYLHTNSEQQFIHRDIRPTKILLDDKWVAKIVGFEYALPVPNSMVTDGVEMDACGTLGYYPREHFLGMVTKKTDVYAFGVLLLEVLCVKTPVLVVRNENDGDDWLEACNPKLRRDNDEGAGVLEALCAETPMFTIRETDEGSISAGSLRYPRWLHLCIERGIIDELIDPYLIGKIAPECFWIYVNLALSCLADNRVRHPSINDLLGRHQSANGWIRRPSMNEVLGSLQSSLQMQEAWEKSVEMADELHMADVPLSNDDVIDQSLNGETTPHRIAEPKEGPTMSEVVERLKIALVSHERQGGSHGTTAKASPGNGLNDGGGPILGDDAQSRYSRLSLADILAATNNFNDDHLFVDNFYGVLITRESPYKMYEGCLEGVTGAVIIKRYKSNLENFTERVRAEIQVQSLPFHRNIHCLIGFCEEEHELILVYKYMVNGTLNGCLYETRNNPLLNGCPYHNNPLHWEKRLEICIDIARGLKHLHTNPEQQFIHRDIRPTKIFLDDELVPKIAGFEYAIPVPNSMATDGLKLDVCGTYGYLVPEFSAGKVTKKTDVFAFGVVLMEVLCAKTPAFLKPNRNQDKLTGMLRYPYWLHLCIGSKSIDELIDPWLIGKIAPECFKQYVNVALSCLVQEDFQRPSMNDVLRCLQSSLQMQKAWENSIQIMSDELRMANVPKSYNHILDDESEFTIGEQSYLISNMIRTKDAIPLSLSGYWSSEE